MSPGTLWVVRGGPFDDGTRVEEEKMVLKKLSPAKVQPKYEAAVSHDQAKNYTRSYV